MPYSREKNNEYSRRYRSSHPESSEKHNKLYYKRHRESELERKRIYYQEVRKKRDSTDEGRLVGRLKKAARRVGGKVTAEDWQEILELHGHRCSYCKRSDLPLEMDHLIPISRGGEHVPNNVVPACKPCNSSKGNREGWCACG